MTRERFSQYDQSEKEAYDRWAKIEQGVASPWMSDADKERLEAKRRGFKLRFRGGNTIDFSTGGVYNELDLEMGVKHREFKYHGWYKRGNSRVYKISTPADVTLMGWDRKSDWEDGEGRAWVTWEGSPGLL